MTPSVVASGTVEPLPGTAPVPAISVVIPHFNQPEALAACLAALAAQDFAGPVEVIVVDNGSHARPEAALDALAGAGPEGRLSARLADEAAPGPGPARNRGVALSRAPIVAFTDADCLPEPGWLAAIAARFAADPGIAALGGEVRVHAADPARPSMAEAFDIVYGFRQERQIARHSFAATANLAVRREVFDAVGPFGNIEIAEDMDWGQRATRLGYGTRFAPEAAVRHPARASMAALRVQWDRHIDHHWRMAASRPLGRLRWLAAAGAVAASPLGEIGPIWRTDRLTGLRARLLAFAGVVRLRLYRARRMLAVMLGNGGQGVERWNRA